MKIVFTFDTEKDNPQRLIDMLSNFIEGSVGSDSPILKEYTTVTTRRPDKRLKVSYEDAQEIRRLCQEGKTLSEVGEMYSITPQYVSLIKRNKCRIHY
jgi:hypothetical protein